MPIATRGALKTLDMQEMRGLGAEIILSNTYHLLLRPGEEGFDGGLGPLTDFMGWHGPVLTDSGGYQVFSLGALRTITDEGVRFRSHLTGEQILLTPERSVLFQAQMGVDIAMVLDECPKAGSSIDELSISLARTTAWARRCKEAYEGLINEGREIPALYGIVQGGTSLALRKDHLARLLEIGFDGYAIGGLSVGETKSEMWRVLEELVPLLPVDKPRYLMGVGTPDDIIRGVAIGIDQFDCVLPTRNARHGTLFVRNDAWDKGMGAEHFGILRIHNEQHKYDQGPLDPYCDCATCMKYSRAYLRYLFQVGEPLAAVLATRHNLRLYLRMMQELQTVGAPE